MAPDFELPDDQGKVWSLRELRSRGPVIVVFYYGYHCSHCVAQLFGLEEDSGEVHETRGEHRGAHADPVAETASKFRQYGRFHFPVLADSESLVAEKFGVYRRATATADESLKHGTFIVSASGHIDWAYSGNQPFLDNAQLLALATRPSGKTSVATKNERPLPPQSVSTPGRGR